MSFRNAKGGYIRPGYDPLEVANPPTGASASAGNQTASVSFTAPTNTGGSAITNYYAVSNPGQITASSVTSPISVSGLTNGTEYTFKVWGDNSYGPSAYSAPTGAVTPVADYIEDVFSAYLYTGTGANLTINNGINLSGKGGLVWVKARSEIRAHYLIDTVRGATKTLSSNSNAAESTLTNPPALASFNTNGFTLGADNSTNNTNTTFVSWTFEKQAKFFDVVEFTTNGSGNATVAHSLGSTPGFILIKTRTAFGGTTDGRWFAYHRSFNGGVDPGNFFIVLNTTAEGQNAGATWITPSTTNFTITGSAGILYANTTYICYLFAHNAGGFGDSGSENVITCGSFATDSSGRSTISLGYEPQWVLVKRISGGTGSWEIADNMRAWTVSGNAAIYANLTNAENNPNNYLLDSTGFSANNGLGNSEFIYVAIRRGPMKTPTTGTSVFMPFATGSSGGPPAYISGFVTDLVMTKDRGSVGNNYIQSRLTGTGFMLTNLTNSEATDSLNKWDYMNGWYNGVGTVTYENWWGALFRRAPGFFDVVCWTGTTSEGTPINVSHNLGVVPELIITKKRSQTASWFTYHSALTAANYVSLNSSGASVAYSNMWNDTTPTSTVFTTAYQNASGDTYVAYLFATVAGVSKVGSYTGTGTTLQVNCGFTGGARFVLIKRTDSTGDWYVWDSARGIVSGNDPYLLLNSTAAEVTNTDYIDTYSQGFEISSTAPAAINANGGTFIFLAIA